MWAEVRAGALPAILTPVVVWLLFRPGGRAARVEDGVVVLGHGWGITVLGAVCIGIGAFMLSVPLMDPTGLDPLWLVVMVLSVGAAMLAACCWFVAAGQWEEVRVGPDGIEADRSETARLRTYAGPMSTGCSSLG